MERPARSARLALTHKPQLTMSVAAGPAHEIRVIAEHNLLALGNVSGGETDDGCTFGGRIRDFRIRDAGVVEARHQNVAADSICPSMDWSAC